MFGGQRKFWDEMFAIRVEDRMMRQDGIPSAEHHEIGRKFFANDAAIFADVCLAQRSRRWGLWRRIKKLFRGAA